jgi:hypothetical protein
MPVCRWKHRGRFEGEEDANEFGQLTLLGKSCLMGTEEWNWQRAEEWAAAHSENCNAKKILSGIDAEMKK